MKKKHGFPHSPNPSADAFFDQPSDCYDMVNKYGTYEIQPTADTENTFPMIAHGLPQTLQHSTYGKEDVQRRQKKEEQSSAEQAKKFRENQGGDLTNGKGIL